MSADLTWQIVKKSNRFMVRNGTGDRSYFSSEPTNVTNRHNFKSSGIANPKAVGVRAAEGERGGVQLVLKNKTAGNKPTKLYSTVTLKKGARPTLKAIKGLTQAYRADLAKAAQIRASQILRSQKAAKTA